MALANIYTGQTWINADGLFVRFGTDEQVVSRTGEYEDTYGPEQVLEVGFSFTDLGLVAGTPILLNTTSPIRKGSRIQEVVLISEISPTSGGSPTLQIGTVQDDFTTVVAAGGIVNNETLANLNAHGNGTQITYQPGSAATSGTQLGTTIALDNYLTAQANTATFTAGQWLVVVRYYLPSTTE